MIGAAIDARSWARAARLLGGAAILAVLAVRLGTDPFVDGLHRVGAVTLLTAVVVTAGTTWCCAWRWTVLARQLDVALPVGAAYRWCYRSQLLNAVLPLGVLGDVHRGVGHGRAAGALGRGVRSVLWDRASGQVVQGVLAVGAVLLLPAAVRSDVARLLLATVAVVLVVLLVPVRVRRTVVADVRAVLSARTAWPRVAVASGLAAVGHAAVFVVAARAVGVAVPLLQLAALGVVVLLASALPLSVAGWGPREGAAAWLFAEAGLGAATGVTVAVAYGVASFVATLPGTLALAGPAVAARRDPEVVAGG